jgi:RimJ/RimL family protein N-acetyltransferase
MQRQPYVLQTERLGMRRYTVSDVEALRPVFADAYAAKFYPAMSRQEGLERWIHWNLKNYEDYGFGLWALELFESGLFIGDAGITYQTVEDERILEIGWHIHPSFRSMGYATEAGKACLEFAFSGLHASTLGSIVDPANLASIKVASRVHAEKREYQGKAGPMLLFNTTAAQFAARANPSIERTATGKPVSAAHVER